MAYETVTSKWREAKDKAQKAGLKLKLAGNFSAKFENLLKDFDKYNDIKAKAKEPASEGVKEVRKIVTLNSKLIERELRREGLSPVEMSALKELNVALEYAMICIKSISGFLR